MNFSSYIDTVSKDAAKQLADGLSTLIPERRGELVVLCIGTDRATGDSLGPITGTKLSVKLRGVSLFGTLDSPVHAQNLERTLMEIGLLRNPFVLAVDASLGANERIGHLRLNKGPLFPGASLNKKLPQVGDIHVTGVVNALGALHALTLQTTKLGIVYKMAEVISDGITLALNS